MTATNAMLAHRYGYSSGPTYDGLGESIADDMFGYSRDDEYGGGSSCRRRRKAGSYGLLLRGDMFGADDFEAEEAALDEPGGKFKLKAPPWVLPAAGGLAAGVGLTALGFHFLGKKKRKAAAAYAGVDPRVIDARQNDARTGFGALTSPSLTAEEEYGWATYDNVGTSVANEMFGGRR